MRAPRQTLMVLIALLVWLSAAPSADATLATQQFQSTYAAYNPWLAWERWLPQPQCTETQKIYGSEPAVSGKYPVLVYLHSTFADLGGDAEGQVITQLAAAQGFVAIAPTYDSSKTSTMQGDDGHATCMFGQGKSTNVISYACSLPESDCSQGVALAGFSQGGAIALLARDDDTRVAAAWLIGVNGPNSPPALAAPAGTRALPDNRLRIDVGQLDVTAGGGGPLDLSSLEAITDDTCGAGYNCLQADGSGYYIVSNAEVADGIADHCYWMSVHKYSYGCTLSPTVAGLDPGFAPPSTTPWSLISNLNWLRSEL